MDDVLVLARYGPPLVFAAVLLDQLGLPVPSVPLLIACGALAARGESSLTLLLIAAALSSLLADSAWYALGRRQGPRVLGVLDTLSPGPKRGLVRFQRSVRHHRLVSLALAKFVPGLATVAPPLAGALGVPFGTFAIVSACSGLAWASGIVGVGWVFRDSIAEAARWFEALGGWALAVAGVLFAGYGGAVLWSRGRRLRVEGASACDAASERAG